MYNDKDFPFKKIIRTLLLIPYTIPSVITILIWRGMFNPEFGVINRMLNDLIGIAPHWTTEAFWARTAVLLVNLWLGFPYMMLVTSGALQSIPSDLYEAATIDGAGGWKKFKSITLPLLLVAVGPLLIASFTFNFNNFGIIYLFIGGGPPIAGASTQAGYTDILISYDRVRENATTYGVSAQHELRRVMVHGLLHLMGHSDKSAPKRKAMREEEDKYLARLK